MASDKPPALPVKQHRRSSTESDHSPFSPFPIQHANYSYMDVFPDPVDCHAAQCPLHQPRDPGGHNMRCLSDGIPPPIPKKKQTRTLSLPGFLSSVPPPPKTHRHLCHFDDTRDVPSPSISQLTFHSSDDHLSSIFNSFVDQEVVSNALQHSYRLFLKRMVNKVQAEVLLESDTSLYLPEDLLLCNVSRAKRMGHSAYYSLLNPKFPAAREFGLRVHRHAEDSFAAHVKPQPLHVNVQDTIAYFDPSCLPKYETYINHSPACVSSVSTCSATQSTCRGSAEHSSPLTVLGLVQEGHCVSVERDLAHATLEDFVREWRPLLSADCAYYEKQVCFVMLQVLMGTQFLFNRGYSADLRPQEILLLWACREKSAQQGACQDNPSCLQMMKGLRGCPRVVLVPQASHLSGQITLASIKSQIRALIGFCLQPHERSANVATSDQHYHKVLCHLSSLLLKESKVNMADMVTILQVLLWGPHTTHTTYAVAHHWLTIERALLVMKLAERGLTQEGSALDWGDYLYLQYLSSADSETVANVTNQLCPSVNTE